jgi:hypothetical protein
VSDSEQMEARAADAAKGSSLWVTQDSLGQPIAHNYKRTTTMQQMNIVVPRSNTATSCPMLPEALPLPRICSCKTLTMD